VRSLACFLRTVARFARFFSFAIASGGTAKTILRALLIRSASVLPGTSGAGSLFMSNTILQVNHPYTRHRFGHLSAIKKPQVKHLQLAVTLRFL
jgi:hypothetical protein